jgi:hypothetical protein
MEQPVEVAGGPSQLVHEASRAAGTVHARPRSDSQRRLLTKPSAASSGDRRLEFDWCFCFERKRRSGGTGGRNEPAD